MLRYAIDHGVNFLDLGCPYEMSWHERRTRLIGQALEDGYRRRIRVAANLPSFLTSSSFDLARYIAQHLEWLGTDKLDFFLLGGLNRETWPRLRETDIISQVEKAIASGRIDKLGFSFHDHFQALRTILTDYDNWTFCQFQYSYMDIDHHPGVSGVKYAASKGLAVVATQPFLGGRLVKKPPESVARVWAGATKKRSLVEWGLIWVWNHPEISTLVSDMSTLEQVKENIALAEIAQPNSLSVAEEVLISRVRDAYRSLRPINCTACRGCMPCPQGIDVPRIFELYNDAIMYDDVKTAQSIYLREQHRIEDCTECGLCVDACGRRINILDWLRAAQKLFGVNKPSQSEDLG